MGRQPTWILDDTSFTCSTTAAATVSRPHKKKPNLRLLIIAFHSIHAIPAELAAKVSTASQAATMQVMVPDAMSNMINPGNMMTLAEQAMLAAYGKTANMDPG